MERQLQRHWNDQTSVEKIQVIVNMTEKGCSRPEIAEEVELSKQTVYKYQKRMDLI